MTQAPEGRRMKKQCGSSRPREGEIIPKIIYGLIAIFFIALFVVAPLYVIIRHIIAML